MCVGGGGGKKIQIQKKKNIGWGVGTIQFQIGCVVLFVGNFLYIFKDTVRSVSNNNTDINNISYYTYTHTPHHIRSLFSSAKSYIFILSQALNIHKRWGEKIKTERENL